MWKDIERISRVLGDSEIALCCLQADVFVEAYLLGISPCYFSALFMQSPVASLFDRSQDNYRQPAVLNHLPKNIIITTLTLRSDSLDQYTPPLSSDENEQRYCYWLGFIYRCEQLCMCVSSHFIIDSYPEKFMRSAYEHMSDAEISLPNDAYEICRRLELLRQEWTP